MMCTCDIPKDTCQAETMSDSEKSSLYVALVITELHWYEGISPSVSRKNIVATYWKHLGCTEDTFGLVTVLNLT